MALVLKKVLDRFLEENPSRVTSSDVHVQTCGLRNRLSPNARCKGVSRRYLVVLSGASGGPL